MSHDVFDLYAVSVNGSLIGGVTEQSGSAGSEARGEATSGALYPVLMSLVGQRPGATLTTLALKSAIDMLGLTGVPIGVAGAILYLQKREEGGTRASGSVHRKYQAASGIVVPRRLRCGHQQDATLEIEIVPIYDGTNAPIVVTDNVALPTQVPALDEGRWTMGPVTLGNIPLPGKQAIELDFGIELDIEAADSDLYPTHVSVRSIHPVLTLQGITPAWVAASGAIPMTGQAAGHANSTVYLRKRANGGTFVAAATEEHIKFTVCGLVAPDELFRVGRGAATSGLRIPLYHDGTNAPAIIDTTAALPS
jgi:hypothetical protein